MIGVLIALVALGGIQGSEPHIKAAASQYEAGAEALARNNYDSSIEHFRQAIAIEPTYTEAYEKLADAYETAKRPVDMAHTITALLQIKPELVSYRLRLARYLLDSGDAQRALAQYSVALQADSKNADALFGFMNAAAKAGMADRAAFAKARAHDLYPADKRFQ